MNAASANWPRNERVRRWLRRGLLLFVVLLPWQTRWIWREGELAGGPWEFGTLGLAATDILLLFLILGAIMFGPWRSAFTRAPRFWTVAGAFAVVAVASSFLAKDTGLAFVASLRVVEGLSLVWLWMTVGVPARSFAFALGASAGIQALFALAQFALQDVPGMAWFGLAPQDPADPGVFVVETPTGRYLRAYGSLHPLLLAAFLSTALAFVVTAASSVAHRIRSWLFGLEGLMVLGIVLTFSRVAWAVVALAVAGTAVLVRAAIRHRLWSSLLTVTIAGLACAALFAPFVTTRLHADTRLEQRSIDERWLFFEDASAVLRTRWAIGVGVAHETLWVADHVDRSRESYDYQPPNNLFIAVAAEVGLLGLALFAWSIVEAFRAATIRLTGTTPERRVWLGGSLVASGVLLVNGMFDHTLWTHPVGILLFWLILATLLSSEEPS